MWIDLLAVFLTAALCGAWVLAQRWIGAHDPCQPGVEGQCGCKGAVEASCRRKDAPAPARVIPHPSAGRAEPPVHTPQH